MTGKKRKGKELWRDDGSYTLEDNKCRDTAIHMHGESRAPHVLMFAITDHHEVLCSTVTLRSV